jgi:hypothetical protein
MRPIYIGKSAAGAGLHISPELRHSTHSHIIGGSGTGKSKFLEWMIQQDIGEGHGFCLIDWHGTLYQDVLNYCGQLDVGLGNDFRKLILLNPSRPDFITGFNPFMNQGVDVATQVANRIGATIRPWGISDTNEMPTFEKVLRLIYTFAVQQRETLPNTALLLDEEREELRDFAIEIISDPYIRSQWRKLDRMSTRDRDQTILSTENRLSRFLSSKTIKRFFGLKDQNLNLQEIMDDQRILLVNLGSSGFLDRESARVFASLMLNEFFETAMLRANEAKARGEDPQTFTLYLDEFQEYITDDIAAMLDQVRKGGLHLVLAHQHLGHLADNPKLRKSIFTNARIRAVFGGLDYEDACVLANEMFLPDLNTRQIKKAYYHTIHLYREETRTAQSYTKTRGTATSENWSTGTSTGSNSGSGTNQTTNAGSSVSTSKSLPGSEMTIFTPFTEGWFTKGETRNSATSNGSSSFASQSQSDSESYGGSQTESQSEAEGETVFPVWVPIPVQELGSEAEWSREEKVSKVAEMLKCQQQRHCFIKLDIEKTQPMLTPFVKDYFHSQEYLLEYEQAVYRAQGALPASQVDELLIEGEQRFLNAAQAAIDIDARDVKGEAEKPEKEPKPTPRRRTKPTKPKKQTPYDDLLNNPTYE